jgi:putative oxidoreductase
MSVALLVIRLALGSIMFAHGAQKLLGWFGGHGVEATLGFMGQMGIPALLAWAAILAEFFGGIALIVGVLARLAALAVAIDMAVAMLMVHAPNGFFMGGPQGSGIEFTLMLCAAATAILIAGPGRYAIAPDLEWRLLRRRSEPQPLPRHA